MKCFCVFHQKVHDDTNWKYVPLETEHGVKYGYICHTFFKPSQLEYMPQRIKEDRKKNFNSMLQSRRDGILSREYIDAYGPQEFKPEEVKKAKNVWSDVPGWSDRKRSQ
jgi:hypothetical protein